MASQCTEYHAEIEDCIKQGLTNPQIAKKLKLSKGAIANYVQKKLGGNPNYLAKIAKHNHLHRKILEMRLKLDDATIRETLKLSKGEMKSCMAYAYRDKSLAHIRKDTRRRDAWSTEELIFLLRWSGLISRDEINEQLNRGKSSIVIKEKLQSLGLCSKNVNGLTYSQFCKLFKAPPLYYVETSAGSPASKFAKFANWKIVPWVHIEELLKEKQIDHGQVVKNYVKAMAMFQRWIHQGDFWSSIKKKPIFQGSGECDSTKSSAATPKRRMKN